ncbi:MAG: 2-oxo acid dehydrogenase subunit E2 [Anaerolineae bacterium]
MATEVIMPKFGMTQEEATVLRWLKGEGDAVEKDEPILQVETDKVVMEVEAPASGILRGLRCKEGDVVPVTEVIAYILAPGEKVPGTLEVPGTREAEVAATPVARRLAEELGLSLSEIPGTGVGGKVTKEDVEAYLVQREEAPGEKVPGTLEAKVRATPAARRVAREQGIDLRELAGSGPRGRVQAADVEAAARKVEAAAPAPPAQVIPLRGMRKTIAERMQTSARTAPHITLNVEVEMTNIRAIQPHLAQEVQAETGSKLSLTAMLVKAVAWALKKHPLLNATLREGEIHLLSQINIGVAVALEEGLIVPVVHGADRKSLARVAYEVDDLAERARAGRLTLEEVTGGTFTLSNLGMFGVDSFTAIINPPESAILAVGKMEERPVVRDGQLVARPMMTMTLSADHRIVDGAVAARFLQDLRAALEAPSPMLWEGEEEKSDVIIHWKGGMAFEGVDRSGRKVLMDTDFEHGGQDRGFRPLQLLLVGLAGCTGMDVASILRKKGEQLTDFQVRIKAKRAENHPRIYTDIHIEYVLRGVNLSPDAVERAISLSQEKYCPASAMLRKAANISYSYRIIGNGE